MNRSTAFTARVLLLAVALALLVPMGTGVLVAQAPQAAAAAEPAIPAGEWDDDWWYPEGRISILGQRFSLMTGVTLTRFTRRSSRDAFGALRADPAIDLYRPEAGSGLATDFDFLWTGITEGGARAGFIAPTLGVRFTPFAATRDRWLVPRISLRAGPYFASTSTSGNATVLGANAAVGVDVARRLSLVARYDLVRGVRGHDLSSTAIEVKVRVPLRSSRRARPKMHDDVPPPGRLIDVGGHRLHLVCVGSGSPTVVFEAGMSDAWVSWDRLLPELATTTRACAYDRAGIGYSDPGPLPRDSRRIVAELHALLERAGERPPYVLVGHSFGGYNVRLFASEHPDEVVGMVLVDATHEDFQSRNPAAMREQFLRATDTFRALAERGERGERLPPVVPNLPLAVASRPAWYRTLYEEARTAEVSGDEVRAARRALAAPLIVITAGRSAGGGSARARAELKVLWSELQADLVRLSPQGVHVFAERSGHYVQRSEPQLVIAAVRRVVERARTPD